MVKKTKVTVTVFRAYCAAVKASAYNDRSDYYECIEVRVKQKRGAMVLTRVNYLTEMSLSNVRTIARRMIANYAKYEHKGRAPFVPDVEIIDWR